MLSLLRFKKLQVDPNGFRNLNNVRSTFKTVIHKYSILLKAIFNGLVTCIGQIILLIKTKRLCLARL